MKLSQSVVRWRSVARPSTVVYICAFIAFLSLFLYQRVNLHRSLQVVPENPNQSEEIALLQERLQELTTTKQKNEVKLHRQIKNLNIKIDELETDKKNLLNKVHQLEKQIPGFENQSQQKQINQETSFNLKNDSIPSKKHQIKKHMKLTSLFKSETIKSATETPDLRTYNYDDTPIPMPPHVQTVEVSSINDLPSFSHHLKFWKSAPTLHPPALDTTGGVYVMNAILVPESQYIAVFLLTHDYFARKGPAAPLYAEPTTLRSPSDVPHAYKIINTTLIPHLGQSKPGFACIFTDRPSSQGTSTIFHIAMVDYIPNKSTSDGNVNAGTEIMRCRVPIGQMERYAWGDPSAELEFILTQRWSYLTDANSGNTLVCD